MRITFVLPPVGLFGGIRVVAIYAQRLKRRGHQVTVVSPLHAQPGLRRKVGSLLRGKGWPSASGRQPSHFDNVDVEHRVLERYRPVVDADVPDADVVVATWWETAEWVWQLSPSKGAKVYFLQHNEVDCRQPPDRVRATWRKPMYKIAVAQWLVDLAAKDFGDPHAGLVPNSVDLTQFTAPPRGKRPRPTVGMMYSTTPFKGCDISLKAFDLAARRVSGLHLAAFGATEISLDLPLPHEASYTRRPQQQTIKDIYAACDAWLFASRSEGFGLPILEAMACRTPVIGTPTGAAPELIGQGGGILVPHEDPAAMSDAIERVCNLPDAQWRKMSDAAYATASRYTWDDATDLFEAALVKASRIELEPLTRLMNAKTP